jgi:hypothetical protein
MRREGSEAPGGGGWDRGTGRGEGSGTPGGGGWDRNTGRREEEDQGLLVEEDGIGAQVEEKRRIRGSWWRRKG